MSKKTAISNEKTMPMVTKLANSKAKVESKVQGNSYAMWRKDICLNINSELMTIAHHL